ncbi:MAG: 50S ribosomal protein L39, partial [Nitrososphaerota archaeon]|nr:50S ribosomal protein L39 [Nitrososphaerota archaeon]
MGSIKTGGEKKKLLKRMRQANPPPAWVTVRTKRRMVSNRTRRN